MEQPGPTGNATSIPPCARCCRRCCRSLWNEWRIARGVWCGEHIWFVDGWYLQWLIIVNMIVLLWYNLHLMFYSPHLFVGFLFLVLYPVRVLLLLRARFVTHTQLCHNFVTRTHTHATSFTHNFVTHHLSHTTLSHITWSHTLCHTHTRATLSHTQLCHTTLSYTHSQSFTHSNAQLCHRQSWRHPPSFCVAGVALGDIHLRFAWQAWHFTTSTFVLRGRRGTYGTGLALAARLGAAWAPLVAGDAAALCVAGVALGETHLRFAWQAWHLGTSTFVLRGRRGTYSAGLGWLWWRAWARLVAGDATALCVAGVALGDIHLPLRGRGGTWRHPPSFAWQGWHLATSTFVFAGQAWDLATSTLRLRGRAALVALSHTQLCHAQLCPSFGVACRRGTCSNAFTHTQLFHSHKLQHTALSHANLSHAHISFTHKLEDTHTLPHTTLPHTTFYTQFFHTQRFTQNSFTHNSFTHCLSRATLSHTTLSHTHSLSLSRTHITLSHTALSHTVLSHNLSSAISFLSLSHFHTCFELVGRSWHVGLSGPLIIMVKTLWWFNVANWKLTIFSSR